MEEAKIQGADLIKVINKMTLSLQGDLQSQAKQRYCFSGLSLYLALSMLQEGTSGVCLKELEEKCGISSDKTTRQLILSKVQKSMATLLGTESTAQYLMGNGLFLRDDTDVKADFKSVLQNSYKAAVGPLDKDQINKWVEDQTNSKIKDLCDEIDPMMIAMLINAVYFKGNWAIPFEKSLTQDEPFAQNGNESNQKKVPMMHLKKKYNNGIKKDKSGNFYHKLDYEGCNLSMVFCLPPKETPLGHSLDSDEKIESVTNWGKSRPMESQPMIPRFEMSTTLDLKTALQAKGVSEIFIDGANKFDGMFQDRSDVYVGKVVQKTFVQVNEEGTEAVAATKVEIMMRGIPPPPTPFHLNRPFSFYIIDNEGLILFNGAVNEL